MKDFWDIATTSCLFISIQSLFNLILIFFKEKIKIWCFFNNQFFGKYISENPSRII